MRRAVLYNAGMPIKINVKSVIMYAIYTAVLLCLNSAAGGVPLGAAVCFSMLVCGTNIIAVPLLYAACSAINLSWISSLCALGEAAFLALITFVYRRTRRKIRAEAAIYLVIALLPFVIFSPWDGITDLIFTDNEYVIKSLCAVGVIVFYFLSFKCVYACIYRVYRCRLRPDELVCITAVYCAAGIGLYRMAGEFPVYCMLVFATLFTVRLLKSPAAVIAACALATPVCVCKTDLMPVTECVVLAVTALAFCNYGRFAVAIASAPVCAAYFSVTGYFDVPVTSTILRALLLLCMTVAVTIPSERALSSLNERLSCRKILPETEMDHFKARTGEKLYRLSEVFREIESAFSEMDSDVDDAGVKKRMMTELKQACCANCERRKRCERTVVYTGFAKLINAGCVKGKVSLVDLPGDVTVNCVSASEVINQLNRLLTDYRRFMTEAENARSGRRLLADQARGIADVMKVCAVDVSKKTANNYDLEQKLKKRLASCGVVCTELYIRGEENSELCAAVTGKVNASAVGRIITETTGEKFVLRDKTVYDGERSLLVYSAPPRLDAAFGVAYAVKEGGRVSGDTHSVIKINDHSFLMALSDGMGSGEYARKVSATAISLIEAFYRAEMPENTVLDTINKLLSFSREERFACIDIAAIDLNSGQANFVKIGSPVGLIVREGEIRVLESQSLPLGILDNLKPSACTEQLGAGDIVTFMSDGVTSAFNSTPELCDFLQGLKPLNPQNLADKILAGALKRTNGKVYDDMTVLCTRIF